MEIGTMPKLVCETCGEVVEEDIDESDADNVGDQHRHVEDQRSNQPDPDGTEQSDEPGQPDESDEDGDEDSDGLDERTDVEDMEEELEEDFDEKLDEVTDDEKMDDTTDDVEDYVEGGGAADVDDVNLEIKVGDSYENPNPRQRWEECERNAQPISRIFQDKLRQKRKNKTHRGQRSGRFDSDRMMDADRGSPRVFKRQEEGEELEYETYFVLDRSTSMSPNFMTDAEDAAATLMIALEEAGIKTELVDFYGGDARVINTKSQDASDEDGNILVGRRHTKGGTPLGDVMQILADRVEGVDGQPFVVVVTDGKPGDEDKYTDALDQLNQDGVPALGVTIGDDSNIDEAEQDRLFNHHVTVEDTTFLTEKLEALARGVML